MPFEITIPLNDGTLIQFDIEAGQLVFLLGANGSGKSSLIQRLYTTHRNNARRISAHRQTWFSSNGAGISASDRKNLGDSIINVDSAIDARWRDHYSEHRANISIYDLIDSENVRARSIATAFDNNDLELARLLSSTDAPLKTINELLRLSNLPIKIAIQAAQQIMASRSGGPEYGISELSDGERNALLIAANILTAPSDTIIFIDEPERHLHRSIISPLLTSLFAQRADCAFVVSTHDVMLPLDNVTARTVLIRGCSYEGQNVTAWDADMVPANEDIADDLKRDILGSRRKLLFVEGDEQSLDKPLYSLIFPQVSVVGKSSCRDVEHAVIGIRGAENLHWMQAFGIVDNDRRTAKDIEKLESKGVYAVPAFSVESLYYHPEIQHRLAERQAALTGANAATALEAAKAAAIEAVAEHRQRLSERVVEATLRQELMSKLPKRAEVAAGEAIEVRIDVAAVVNEEADRLEGYCVAGDLGSIVARYPIRETGALGQIADRLGFKNRRQYEESVRKMLMDDPGTLAFMRGLFGKLAADIDAG